MIVKYKFEVDRRHRGRKVIEEKAPRPPKPKVSRSSTKAQRLALAYFIERAIDAGVVRDFADVARRLKISRARVTQIVDLMVLVAQEQDEVLRDEH